MESVEKSVEDGVTNRKKSEECRRRGQWTGQWVKGMDNDFRVAAGSRVERTRFKNVKCKPTARLRLYFQKDDQL